MKLFHKIFFSFAGILLLSILVTLLFGNSMMERLYLNSKANDLQTAYHEIADVLLSRNCDLTLDDALRDVLYPIEKNNINIMLLTMQGQQAYVHYFSRENWLTSQLEPDVPVDFKRMPMQQKTDLDPFRSTPNFWIADAAKHGVFHTATLPLLVTENQQHHPGRDTLDYYGKLSHNDETVYIFLRTPREAVALAANLAVRYNLYLALLSFALMAIMSYFVTRRITRPIEQISQATDRISQMNFTQQCDVHTGDELETLGKNINSMAIKLQDYIHQLQLNQSLLEKDLERETKTNQLRQEFIANVSHDFKTPLTLIRAYTETMRNQALDQSEQTQYCDIILQESDRMNRLVTQLLQLSKLESGMVQLTLSFFPLEELIRQIVHQNQLLLQKKQLHIIWDCGSCDHIVQGDYQRIEQALCNLIENAIKYTPEAGQIIFSVQSMENTSTPYCHIAITNTSQPLTDEQLEHLFISFYKVDESRHLEQQSFGLGLAIVKATMDLHQQSCTAKNTTNGLQIAFTLPLLQDTAEEEGEDDDFSDDFSDHFSIEDNSN